MFFTGLGQIYQYWPDRTTPYTVTHWVTKLPLSFVYIIRVHLFQGWYTVTYAMGIYHLNLFIAFLFPYMGPFLMKSTGLKHPTEQNEQFHLFIQRLPEFKFSHTDKGVMAAVASTFLRPSPR
ncbi:LOW QUALITY PROTEIN: protein RER1 [Ctenodactylus gundi]